MPRSTSLSRAVRSSVFLLALVAAASSRAQISGGFGESIEVRRVEIDVVVTDEAGNPVEGLGPEEFELYEAGRRVEILNFAEYRDSAPASPQASGEASPASQGSTSAPAAPPVSWVLYVDGARVPPGPRNDATRQIGAFLDRHASAGDRFLVAGFDGDELRLYSALGSDRSRLPAVLAEIARSAGDAASRRGEAQQILMSLQSVGFGGSMAAGLEEPSAGNRGAERANQAQSDLVWTELESYLAKAETQARGAIRALDELLALVSGLDERVALLLVGGELETRPGEALLQRVRARVDSSPGALPRLRQLEGRLANLTPEVHRLMRRANSSRVTIFTIDVGEGGFGPSGAEARAMPALGESSRSGSATASVSLRELAATTGGLAFTGSPKLGERLADAARDLATYYSLAYEPAIDGKDSYRPIEVRLRRPGLRARARAGVLERPASERADDAALSALLGGELTNELGIQATVVEAPDAAAKGGGRERGRGRTMTIDVAVPLGGILLAPEGGLHRGRLSFHFALADEHDQVRKMEPKTLDFTVPNDRLAQALGERVVYSVQIPLTPGRWRLAIVAGDAVGGARSGLLLPIELAGRE